MFLNFNGNPKYLTNFSNNPFDQIYNVYPKEYPSLIQLQYPHVSTSPKNLFRYAITSFKEKNDLKNNRFNSLFFAAKRVEEMSTWKDELKVLGKIIKVESWWTNNEPTILRPNSFKIYDSWEAQLARYHQSMSQAIENNDTYEYSSDKNPSHLPKYLTSFENKISLSIEQSNLRTDEKKYLINIVDSIHKDLYSKIKYENEIIEKSSMPYSLTNINKNKQFGLYKIQVPYKKDAEYIPSKINIGNKLYKLNCNQKNCIVDFAEINQNNTTLLLQYEDLTTLIPLNTNGESVTFSIPAIEPSRSIIAFSSQSNDSYTIDIYQEENGKLRIFKSLDITSLNKNKIYYVDIPSGNKPFQGKIYTNNGTKVDSANFNVVQIPQLLNKITLTFLSQPYNMPPKVSIEEVGFNKYKLITHNLSIKQQEKLFALNPLWQIKSKSEKNSKSEFQISYWPLIVFSIVFKLSLLFIILLFGHLLLMKYRTKKKYSHFLKYISNIFIKFNYLLIIKFREIINFFISIKKIFLTLSISLSFLYIMFINFTFPTFIVLLFLLWFITLLFFKMSSDFLFILSYISLFALLFLIPFNQWLLIEKFAIFSFYFFSIGVLIGIIENFTDYKTKSIMNIITNKNLMPKNFN
jgi:hypothetical protein